MTRNSGKMAIVSAIAALLISAQQDVLADVMYWDSNEASAGTGGAGTWDASSSFWRLGAADGALQAWLNAGADSAYFGGTAGTVTLNGDSTNISVAGMTFATNNYTIAAPSAGTAALDLSGATPTITTNTGVTATIGAQIASGALVKDGAGALVLKAANGYAGGTTLNAGTLHVNNASALGTGKLTINGGTLTYSGATNTTGMALSTNNAQDWNGDFTYAGKASQSDPKVNWSLNLGTGAVTLGGNRIVTVSGYSSTNGWAWDAATLTVGGSIGDGGNGYSLTKNGTGALRLAAANTFTGGITLNAGTLQLAHAQALGSGRLTINGGTIYNATGASLTLSDNPQTWSGGLTLATPSSTSMSLGTGAITLAGNTTVTVVKDIWGARTTVGGNIGDDGNGYGLTIQANGTNSGSIQLSGQNTFSGGVTLKSGILRIGSNTALGTGLLTISGGTIQQDAATTLTGISGMAIDGDLSMSATSGAINLGTAPVALSGARSITLDNGSATIGGAISGAAASLALKGTQWAGTYTLNGASTFGGGLTVTPGTSSVTVNIGNLGTDSSNSAIGTGTLRFYSASTGAARIDNTSGAAGTLATNNAQAWDYNFTFIGTNDLNMGTGAVTLGGNRTVTVSAKTLTIGGAIDDGANTYGLTKAGAGTLVLAGANIYGGDTTVSAGVLTLDTAGSILLDINDGSNSAILGTGTVNLNGTLALDVADVTTGAAWTLIAPGLTDNYGSEFGLMLSGSNTEFVANGTLYSASFGGKDWSFDRTTGELSVAVPEPGTVALLAGVGLMLAARRRRSA